MKNKKIYSFTILYLFINNIITTVLANEKQLAKPEQKAINRQYIATKQHFDSQNNPLKENLRAEQIQNIKTLNNENNKEMELLDQAASQLRSNEVILNIEINTALQNNNVNISLYDYYKYIYDYSYKYILKLKNNRYDKKINSKIVYGNNDWIDWLKGKDKYIENILSISNDKDKINLLYNQKLEEEKDNPNVNYFIKQIENTQDYELVKKIRDDNDIKHYSKVIYGDGNWIDFIIGKDKYIETSLLISNNKDEIDLLYNQKLEEEKDNPNVNYFIEKVRVPDFLTNKENTKQYKLIKKTRDDKNIKYYYKIIYDNSGFFGSLINKNIYVERLLLISNNKDEIDLLYKQKLEWAQDNINLNYYIEEVRTLDFLKDKNNTKQYKLIETIKHNNNNIITKSKVVYGNNGWMDWLKGKDRHIENILFISSDKDEIDLLYNQKLEEEKNNPNVNYFIEEIKMPNFLKNKENIKRYKLIEKIRDDISVKPNYFNVFLEKHLFYKLFSKFIHIQNSLLISTDKNEVELMYNKKQEETKDNPDINYFIERIKTPDFLKNKENSQQYKLVEELKLKI